MSFSLRELDAFIDQNPYLDAILSQIPGCPFTIVPGKPISRGASAIAFSKKSPWKRPISHLMEIYRHKEHYRLLMNKWFGTECRNFKTASKMDIHHLGGLFLVCFAVSPVVCLFLLIIENLWYRKIRSRKRIYVARQESLNPWLPYEEGRSCGYGVLVWRHHFANFYIRTFELHHAINTAAVRTWAEFQIR